MRNVLIGLVGVALVVLLLAALNLLPRWLAWPAALAAGVALLELCPGALRRIRQISGWLVVAWLAAQLLALALAAWGRGEGAEAVGVGLLLLALWIAPAIPVWAVSAAAVLVQSRRTGAR